MIAGIASGLSAAFCQSSGYLLTRHYVQRRGPASGRTLLVVGHVWMGLFSLILLPFVWPSEGLPLKTLYSPVIQMSLYYLIGQLAMMIALRHAEPSRVSPLLGMKIAVLAILASFFTQPRAGAGAPITVGLTALQWLGVALACTAAVGLNFSGASLRPRALIAVACACFFYSISDWNIALTNRTVHELLPQYSIFRASLISVGLGFAFCGLCGLLIAPWWGDRSWPAWHTGIPYSVVWFIAMIMLYWCFAEVGPVLGNILQSTRGLISILLGSLFVYLGHLHLESISTRGVFARRLMAGILMFIAISLYVIRDLGNLKFSSVPVPASAPAPAPLPLADK